MTDSRDESLPYWLRTAAPSGANGGLLDSLTRPADEPWNDPRPATFAPTPWGSMTPPNLFGLSPTFPPAPPPSSWDPGSPAFLWHPPFGANAEFPAPPVQPVVEPWNDPRSAIFAQTPWAPMTPPPPFVPPSAFPSALPLEHLGSGKYWPVAPARSRANERPPAHGFYFPPIPQAPSWDSMPTHPADGAASNLSQPPSLGSWAAAAPPLEHLDSGKHWPVAPAPSSANELPPAHGFYFPPVPQAPSWDSVPADASMTDLRQLFPQPPGPASWLASAAGASYSSADEALMADDARRVAADRLKRGMQRPIPTAPPPEHLSPSNPLVHGFYLSPVGQAPSWEQVVPTATPWSVSPKLPSPTAWGETISGPKCYTSDGKLTCITPGGRQLTVPAHGLDDGLEIAPGHPDYHYYNAPVSSPPGDQRRHMRGIVNSPTPGPSFLVRPATPEGTRNEAAPWYVNIIRRDPLEFLTEGPKRWPVKSYRTTDQNGEPMVVNVTQPGHPLYPGVVMRYETPSPSGSTIHNEGTGLAWVQGPRSIVPPGLRDWANDYVWRGQSEDIMKRRVRRSPRGMGLPLGG